MTNQQIIDAMNQKRSGTLMETLEIQYTSIGKDTLLGKMPVSSRHLQPAGILHGGATLSLAETIGSAASNIFIDNPSDYIAVGQEIAANHVKSISVGYVHAEAKFLHKGRSSHVLEIRVTDDDDELISFVKMTNVIISKKRTK
tara:strand:- start:392 stop:820 length:429 start_codon:yes stop_codon:yes gene_type:complete